MRMLMNVKFPLEPFSTAVRDGTAGVKLDRILRSIRAKAAYFTEQDGCRAAVIIVDVKDASMVPALAEPFFLQFQAAVELRIVMTPGDLKKSGLEKLGNRWGKPSRTGR